MKTYGKELILDVHECDIDRFNREGLRWFFEGLCELIDMERCDLHFWDYAGYPAEYANAPSHLKGTSAVQFIKTSNITVHALDDLKRIYLNIFSCKDFDYEVVQNFTTNFFKGTVVNSRGVLRK